MVHREKDHDQVETIILHLAHLTYNLAFVNGVRLDDEGYPINDKDVDDLGQGFNSGEGHDAAAGVNTGGHDAGAGANAGGHDAGAGVNDDKLGDNNNQGANLGENDGIGHDEDGEDPNNDYSEHTGSGDTTAQTARILVQFKANPKGSKATGGRKATGKEPLGETGSDHGG
jgi:hypothetical protein